MNDRHPSPDEVERVDRAVTSRRSIRAFLPRPVARADIEAILDVARRAPSGSNTQPWRVYVLTGESKARLSEAIGEAYDQPDADTLHREEYPYYPRTWVDPYQSRRRKVGWDLYGLLGIGRAEKARMRAQHARNFRFFDAPVGLIFAIDRVMEQGSWLDYGMFLEAVMVAARAAASIPARRRRSRNFTASLPGSCRCRRKRWSCAACRWAMRTRMRSRTHSSPSVRLSPSSPAFSNEVSRAHVGAKARIESEKSLRYVNRIRFVSLD